jgi:hypothetical protein
MEARMRTALVMPWLLLFSVANSTLAQEETSFDSDLGGWTVAGDNVFSGTPPTGVRGCLEVQDAASGPSSVASAPAAYLGDWSGFTAGDSLSYDAIHLPGSGQVGSPPYILRIEGPGGAATFDPPTFPADVWNHFAAPLDPAAWNVTLGTWADVVSNVTSLTVAVEMISGDEVVRVDNIRLSGSPGPVAPACAVAHFEVNLLGRSSESASISRVTTGGDIGAYLRVAESGAAARVLAPAWYTGDWRAMDGVGSVGFSFTILGGAVESGREIRVELTGPGGSAFASEPTDSFLPTPRTWQVLSWPIDESAWNVTAGTWAGLLEDVQEMAISADLSAGNNQYGLDNVARGVDCDSDPVAPLVLHEAGYAKCAEWRFRDGSALAANPADGALYALVNAASGSGGGVYGITGTDGGVRRHVHNSPVGLVFAADGDGFVSENNSGILYRFVGSDSSMTWANTFHAGDDDIAGMIIAPPGFDGPNVAGGDILVTDHGSGGPDEIWAVSPDSANGERLLVPDPGTVDWYDLATDGSAVWACNALDDDALWEIQPDGATALIPLAQPVAGMRALAYDAGQGYLLRSRRRTRSAFTVSIRSMGRSISSQRDRRSRLRQPGDRRGRPWLWIADDVHSRIYEVCLPRRAQSPSGSRRVPPARSLSLHPHPVVQRARISIDLPRASHVRLDVVDAAGRRVRRLGDGWWPAGPASWSGTPATAASRSPPACTSCAWRQTDWCARRRRSCCADRGRDLRAAGAPGWLAPTQPVPGCSGCGCNRSRRIVRRHEFQRRMASSFPVGRRASACSYQLIASRNAS